MYFFPSTWRRLLAQSFDNIYVGILQLPVWTVIAVDFFRSDIIRIHWSHLVYLILVSLLYDILSLYFFSATLGKWQCGLKVISRESNNGSTAVSLEQAILRVLVSRLSFFFGLSLYALAFLKINRTHAADWVANTQVVGLKERQRPRVRWILAFGLILITTGESLRTASRTIDSLRWTAPYFNYEDKEFKKMFEQIAFSLEFEKEN